MLGTVRGCVMLFVLQLSPILKVLNMAKLNYPLSLPLRCLRYVKNKEK